MPLIMRWAHIGASIVAVGGLALLLGALVPSLRAADPEQAVLLLRDVLRRARVGLWVCALALILSGAYGATQARASAAALYHGILGVKVLLGIASLGIALAATALPAGEAGLSRRRTDWLWLALLLGTATVLLSSYLKEIRSP